MNQLETLRDLMLDLERSRRQEAASRLAAEAMVRCLHTLAVGSDPEAMLQALLAEVCRLFEGEDACVLSGIVDGGAGWQVMASTRPSWVGCCWQGGELLRRLDERRPVAAIFDVSLLEGWLGQPEHTGVVSAMHVRIGGVERPTFLVCVSNRRGHFDDARASLAATLAPIAAQAIARAADHRRLREEISDRIRIEEELRRSRANEEHLRRMETIGHLAGGIAHEINTPLQYISDNLHFLATASSGMANLVPTLAEWLRPHMDPSVLDQFLESADFTFLATETPKAIEHCQEGLERVGEIVRSLKAFAEADGGMVVPADLNAAVRVTVDVCRGGIEPDATISTEFQDLPPVPCRIAEIRQVMHILLMNAVRAVRQRPGAGRITVGTRCLGEVAEVVVRDDGCGMDAATLALARSPFLAERSRGQGLAIAHAVLRRHGGSVSIASDQQLGTEVILRLPLESQPQS